MSLLTTLWPVWADFLPSVAARRSTAAAWGRHGGVAPVAVLLPAPLLPVPGVVWAAYMVMTRFPLPQNNGNLPLPFFGGNYPIIILDNIY